MKQKDFSTWFTLKPVLDIKDCSKLFFKEREIWWCSIGCNVGEEIDGKSDIYSRPVLVFKKLTKYSFIGLPLEVRLMVCVYYNPWKGKQSIIESSAYIRQKKVYKPYCTA
jgi:hypothetical protein